MRSPASLYVYKSTTTIQQTTSYKQTEHSLKHSLICFQVLLIAFILSTLAVGFVVIHEYHILLDDIVISNYYQDARLDNIMEIIEILTQKDNITMEMIIRIHARFEVLERFLGLNR